MTAKNTTTRLIGVAMGVAVFVATAPVSGSAEPDGVKSTTGARPSGTRVATKPKPPATTLQSASSRDARDSVDRPWSLQDALPTNSKAIDTRAPVVVPAGPVAGLGRVPLQNGSGSFGLETETKIKPNEFSDARTVPGLDTNTHRPPTYLGLSLSVPTTDKSIIPAPLLPPWARPD